MTQGEKLQKLLDEQMKDPKIKVGLDAIRDMFNHMIYVEPNLYIEDVGYQKSVVQMLKKQGVSAGFFPLHSRDKRERLESVTHMIRNGNVFFPREGAEDLIQQLVYFGVEKHDDLVDAFTIVLHKSLEVKFYELQIFDRELLGL